MNGKELAAAILALPEDQQLLPVAFPCDNLGSLALVENVELIKSVQLLTNRAVGDPIGTTDATLLT